MCLPSYSSSQLLLFKLFLFKDNYTCNKQMICGRFNLLKGEKLYVATCVLSLEEAYKSTAQVARML